MARRLDEYEKLLQSLMLRVDENDQRLIRKTFERVSYRFLVGNGIEYRAH